MAAVVSKMLAVTMVLLVAAVAGQSCPAAFESSISLATFLSEGGCVSDTTAAPTTTSASTATVTTSAEEACESCTNTCGRTIRTYSAAEYAACSSSSDIPTSNQFLATFYATFVAACDVTCGALSAAPSPMTVAPGVAAVAAAAAALW